MTTENKDVQLLDVDFDLFDLDKKPEKAAKKKKKGSCAATKKTAGKKATPMEPKEPEKDLERFVVLTSDNEQMTFPAEMTLEEIRVELEKEYPAYTQKGTKWHFEKQEDKNRYLCVPSYTFNKMG